MGRRIYLASSWRNAEQPTMVNILRDNGHQVYDFRNPPHGPSGFAWSEIDPDWQQWDVRTYRDHLLNSPRAAQGFLADMAGMEWCDTCVLLQPCGRSAHLELGYCKGRGKFTVGYLTDGEPELMIRMADVLVTNVLELISVLKE